MEAMEDYDYRRPQGPGLRAQGCLRPQELGSRHEGCPLEVRNKRGSLCDFVALQRVQAWQIFHPLLRALSIR